MSLCTIGWYKFWIGSLPIFHVVTGLLGKKDSLRKQKEQEQSNITKCFSGKDTGPSSASEPHCPFPSPQDSPRSLKPITPFRLPRSWLDAGTGPGCHALLHAMLNPMGNSLHSKPSEDAWPLEKMTEIRVQVLFPKPDWGIFSSFISFPFTCSGIKYERQRLHAWLWAPTSTSHKCVVYPPFPFF